MYLAYFDESGDDGYPKTSSRLFIQSAVYMHHRNWPTAFDATRKFRQDLAAETPLKFNLELHTRELLLNKDPYHSLGIKPEIRLELIRRFCRHIASLDLRIINVAINKTAIRADSKYQVLDRAITYLIQRIENDLATGDNPFLIITDEGRIGKIQSTARRIQRNNFVPSKFGDAARRKEIRRLIEDPLPKRSHESYFIQFADLCACLTQLHLQNELKIGTWPNRLRSYAEPEDIKGALELLEPCLNLKASSSHPLGIVCYPK